MNTITGLQSLTISINDIKNSRYENCSFNARIDCTNKEFDNDILFSECVFKEDVNFSGCCFRKRVFFYKCTFEKDINFSFTKFEGFCNFADSIFYEKCLFSFSNALSLMNFSDVEFKTNAKLDLHCSHFEKYANFDNSKIEYTHFDNDYLRENARLIKHYCIKTNDKVMAFRFHQYEMKATLKNTKNYTDKLILKLNQISSNFGTHWVRAISFIFYSSIISFTLFYILGINNAPYQWGWVSFESFFSAFSDSIKYYCIILNPTHSLRDLDELHLNTGGFILDILSRILISYGLYQLIISYQKFSRNI